MQWSLWGWAVPAVLVFWALGANNRLTRLRAAVLQAFAVLDTALQAWIAVLAPGAEAVAADAADAGAPAGASADAAAGTAAHHDEAGRNSLRAAAAQLGACLDAARQRTLRRADIAALSAARSVLRDVWQRQQSEAAGTAIPPALQIQWDQRETEVQIAAGRFNEAVARYNQALSQFPASLLAWILRLRRAQGL